MKAVEDISESLNSLSQVISMSFMFAKSSPMKAKKSLTSCAAYLQSKTFKSTSFLIRFVLVLIDLLKNEHVEILILTVLSMLTQLINLLKSKEVQIIITQSLKLAASKPVTNLIHCITKCVKSLFFIIKTDEITKFQKQIWELIEDEEKNAETPNISATETANIIQEGYDNQHNTDIIYEENKIDDNNNDNNNDIENKTDIDDNGSYYSPVRAWYGLTSMFGAYNEESDTSQFSQDENDYDNHNNFLQQNNFNSKHKSSTAAVQRSKSVAPIQSNDSNKCKQLNAQSRRTLSYDINEIGYRNNEYEEKRFGNGYEQKRVIKEEKCEYIYRDENIFNSNCNSVGINDWVYLIHFIDELEDNGDISINEGDGLRKLAMDQRIGLLIIYKCYQNKTKRFIRYAKDILNEDLELKKLKQIKNKSNVLNEISTSLDDIKLNEQNSNKLEKNDNENDEILCID